MLLAPCWEGRVLERGWLLRAERSEKADGALLPSAGLLQLYFFCRREKPGWNQSAADPKADFQSKTIARWGL